MTFATAILMHRGHSPEAIREYAWRDIQAYLTALPYLSQPRFGGSRL